MAASARGVVGEAVRELLRALAALPDGTGPLRVADAAGGLACLVQVWPAGDRMPLAPAERARRPTGARAACRGDILDVVRAAGRPMTRKEVVRALRESGRRHGPGTVGKALAELTRDGAFVNPRDKRGYRLADWPRRARTPSLF